MQAKGNLVYLIGKEIILTRKYSVYTIVYAGVIR